MWFSGPSWLSSKSNWPIQSDKFLSLNINTLEINNEINNKELCENPEPLIPLNRYSSIVTLIRVTKLIHKFVDKLKFKIGKINKPSIISNKDSYNYWLRYIQRSHNLKLTKTIFQG